MASELKNVLANHEIQYIQMEWTDKPLIEHVRHAWLDHTSLFQSRIREEMGGDEQAMQLVDDLEETFRELHNRINKTDTSGSNRRQRVKQEIKEKIKPFVREQVRNLRS